MRLLFLYSLLASGLSQATHAAQLGDPCADPGDCKVPNSECVQTDNLYWNRQNFCVCQAGFHPSTGFCVADSGTDNQTGMIKLDYSHRQQQTTAATATSSSSSGNEETITRNTSVRSLLMTPVPPQNLLQGFHFGNRTQAIVSNLVEQLTHLRGQQPTDQMKERLETLGLPLLQPPQSLAREDSDETTTAPIVPASSADSTGYYLEVVTAPMALGVSATTTSPTQVVNATNATTMPPPGIFNPFAVKPPVAPRAHSTSSFSTSTTTAHGYTPVLAPTPTPTPAILVAASLPALKSSSNGDGNSPFLPPALPPFFSKAGPLRTTASSTPHTTTTLPVFNVTTAFSPATASLGNPADDPEARLALLRKVQNLIVRTSPLTQRPPTTPEPTTPSLNVPVTVIIAASGIAAPKIASTPPPTPSSTANGTAGETVPTEPVPQPAPQPMGQKAHNAHHPPHHPTGMKSILNSLGVGKAPPMPFQPPSQVAIPQPFPGSPAAATPPPLHQPTADFESQQQVRSTLVDRLPGVDFYAVFRSAAENVIREYLGGILTTSAAPNPQTAQAHAMREFMNAAAGGAGVVHPGGAVGNSVEKILEKMIESKSGQGAVLLQVNNHGHHHPHSPHSARPQQLVPTTPSSLPRPKPHSEVTAASPVTSAAFRAGSSGATTTNAPTVTRPRHPFIWRSSSPGHPAPHPLPRIVFTGR